MRGMPVYCRSCDRVFEVSRLFGGSANIRIKNVGTNCPACNGPAQVADGLFRIDEGAVRLIDGNAWTRAQVNALERVYRELQATSEVTPGIIDAIDKISPELGATARALTGKYGKTAAVAGLIAFALTKCSVSFDVKVDLNQIVRDAAVVSQQTNNPKR